MLLNNFFTVTSQETTDNSIVSLIALNVQHAIYQGHFPSQPVVPGVCMMQILAELSSLALGRELAIKSSSQSKFLVPIVPEKFPNLEVKITYATDEKGGLKINGSIYSQELIFFKFKGVFA